MARAPVGAPGGHVPSNGEPEREARMRTRSIVTAGTVLLVSGAAALPATAGAAAAARVKHTFQIVETGARLSADELRFEDSFRVKESPWARVR